MLNTIYYVKDGIGRHVLGRVKDKALMQLLISTSVPELYRITNN